MRVMRWWQAHRRAAVEDSVIDNETNDARQAFALLIPVVVIMLMAYFAPLGFVVSSSVYDGGLTLRGFRDLATSDLFRRVLSTSVNISLMATAVSLLAGYPVALHLARQSARTRALLLVLVMVPFWTSILVKSFAFTLILGNEGVINRTLVWLFGDTARVKLLFNRTGVIIALVHNLIPYVVLPVLASLLAQDRNLAKAAQVMGAGPVRIFWRITLPLSVPGIVAAALMSIVISMSVFVTPALLGGRGDMMIANLVDYYTRETLDWNVAASIAVVLLLLSMGLLAILIRLRGRETVV